MTATSSHAAQPAGASAGSIQHHYDVSNDFYRLWLDPTMTYSCALWDRADNLETAQLRKLDWLLEAAHVQPGGRVLDIGCGWGSGLRRAVEQFSASRAVGLTLSEAQASWVRSAHLAQTDVRVESWRDHQPDGAYDSIVSIGAIEHFVHIGLARAEKVEQYRAFFKKCHAMLAPGGGLGLQSIVWGDVVPDERTVQDFVFIAQEIFPESEFPRLAELVHASERRFEVTTVRNDRRMYARTLREWLRRLRENRRAVVDLHGEAVFARYERYLEVSTGLFDRGHANLVRIGFRKVG